jgi:glycosyltransferase involved in cell wall biosynthesis
VVLPVRNGGHWLRACVRSVLAQTVRDFDLVVLENASEDDGPAWLDSLDDDRLRVIRAPAPLGIEENWARILPLEKNELLTTIGHDDTFDPDYLEEIERLIAAHPGAGLYRTHFRMIDGDGRTRGSCRPMPEREGAAEFLRARLRGERDSFGTGYTMRSADYDRVGGIPPWPRLLFADDALWLRLMRGSYVATAAAERFAYRFHEGSASFAPDLGDLLAAFECYRGLLAELSGDPEAAAAVRDELPGYLERTLKHAYLAALERACAAGLGLDPAERARVREALARHAPAAVGRLDRDWRVRAWQAANALPLRREAARLARGFRALRDAARARRRS